MPHIIKDRALHFHTPLYFIILHYWISIFGNTEFSVRFLSVIFGFLTIFMLYKVGALFFDPETGILGALLAALSIFHIYYSQEARMYSMAGALSLFSIYFFVQLFKERTSIPPALGYIISSTLLIYTHYIGLFVIAAQNIYIGILFIQSNNRRGERASFLKKWALLQSISIVLILPWIKIILSVTGTGHFIDEMLRGERYIFEFPMLQLNTITISFREWASNSVVLLWLFLISAFFALISYRNSKDSNRKKSVLFILIWLFATLIFVCLLLSPLRYRPSYTIAASLAFYLLIAKGIKNINSKFIKIAMVTIIISISFINIPHYYIKNYKQQWKASQCIF